MKALPLVAFLGVMACAAEPILGSVEFVSPFVYPNEEDKLVMVHVHRQGDPGNSVSIEYRTLAETARAGADYLPVEGKLSFAPGETNKAVPIPIYDNGAVDGARSFLVLLTNASGAEIKGNAGAQIVILDNETPVMFDLSFRPPPGFVPSEVPFEGGQIVAGVQRNGRTVVAYNTIPHEPFPSLGRLMPDGSLDATFIPELTNTSVLDIAVQPDQKILVLSGFSLTRLEPDGKLDPSFKTYHSVANGDRVVFGPDEKIALYGETLVRLNYDGTIHPSSERINTTCLRGPLAYAAQSDGKFLVGGEPVGDEPCGDGDSRALVRFNADGSVDETFNVTLSSVVGSERVPAVRRILVSSEGHIYIAGFFGAVNGQLHPALARLTKKGEVDSNYQADAPPWGRPTSAALSADGRVLMSFYLGYPSTPLLRFNTDGSRDGAFRMTGLSRVAAVQPDGKVLISYLGTDGVKLARLFPEPELDFIHSLGIAQ